MLSSENPPRLRPKLSRRRFLVGSAGVAGTALSLIACANPETAPAPPPSPTIPSTPIIEPSPTADVDIPQYFFEREAAIAYAKDIGSIDDFSKVERVLNPEKLDPNYLFELIKKLQENKGTTEQRMNALVGNLAKVGGASGVMIDESGIYLAAAHSMGGFPKDNFKPLINFISLVTHVGVEKTFMVREFMIIPEIDTAIVYAPTGKPKKPVQNLQISTSDPVNGDGLWAWGIVEKREPSPRTYNYGIIHGKTAPIPQKPEDLPYKRTIHADGMKPFGGMSGAPVVDRKGIIVGTISGAIPSTAEKFDDYTGGRVASVLGLNDVVSAGKSAVYSTGFGFTEENPK